MSSGNKVFIEADVDVVQSHLQHNPWWGSEVIRLAGEDRWRVYAARQYSVGPFGAHLIAKSDRQFVAWGVYRKRKYLAYLVKQVKPQLVSIKPLRYLERNAQARIIAGLIYPLLVPVVLSPVCCWFKSHITLQASRLYLPAFCCYVQEIGQ